MPTPPLFIYPFNYLVLSVWTHVYLFHTLNYNLIDIIYSISQIIPALTNERNFRLAPMWLWNASLSVFWNIYWLSYAKKCPKLIFHILCPSPRKAVSLFIEGSIRNQEISASILVAIEVSLLRVNSAGNICMYINQCIHMPLCSSTFCLSIYLSIIYYTDVSTPT